MSRVKALPANARSFVRIDHPETASLHAKGSSGDQCARNDAVMRTSSWLHIGRLLRGDSRGNHDCRTPLSRGIGFPVPRPLGRLSVFALRLTGGPEDCVPVARSILNRDVPARFRRRALPVAEPAWLSFARYRGTAAAPLLRSIRKLEGVRDPMLDHALMLRVVLLRTMDAPLLDRHRMLPLGCADRNLAINGLRSARRKGAIQSRPAAIWHRRRGP